MNTSTNTSPKTGKHNIARTERMRRRSVRELVAFVESGSLSAAAALFELDQRGLDGLGRSKRAAQTFEVAD